MAGCFTWSLDQVSNHSSFARIIELLRADHPIGRWRDLTERDSQEPGEVNDICPAVPDSSYYPIYSRHDLMTHG